MATIFSRKLDLAPSASIDTVALNNKVVLMRDIVKQARVHTINKMAKKIKKLRGKKGTDEQKKQNTEKADRLVQELKVIKVMKPDYVSKYALGSTDKFSVIICKPNTSMEARALARLAEHDIIQKVVKEFREKHADWKDLAAYLMTKHTSREFKKKEKKKMTKVATNVQATEAIVQTYLDEKLAGTGIKVAGEQSVKQANSLSERLRNISEGKLNKQSADENSTGNSVLEKGRSKKLSKTLMNVAEGKPANLDTNSDSDNEYEEIVTSDSSENSKDADECESEGTSDCDNLALTSDHKNLQENSCGDNVDTCTNKGEKNRTNKKQKKDSVIMKPENKLYSEKDNTQDKQVVKDKVIGEMIVKKIDLNTLKSDEKDKEIPIFLLTSSDVTEGREKRKKKDAFFDTGDDDNDGGEYDNEDGDDDGGGGVEQVETDHQRSDSTRRFQTNRTVDTKGDMQRGLKALGTTFLGSLSSSKMMSCQDAEFRSNDDWKRIRHEIREKKQMSERGRGRGNYTGRGGFHGDDRGPSRGGFSRGSIRGSGGRGAYRPMNTGAPRGQKQIHGGGGKIYKNTSGRGVGARGGGSAGGAGPHAGDKVHPSWEASRKRKQQQAVQAFQGKKIKFDD